MGGDDIDRRVVSWIFEAFEAEFGLPLVADEMVKQRIRDAAERAKIELSSTLQTEIHLPFLCAGESGPLHFKALLTRARFDQMIAQLVGRAVTCAESALSDAGLEPDGIDEVLLVGGSTRIPLVIERVEALFEQKANRTINPDEAVALGAAVQAGILSGEGLDILLLDVTPLTLGVETRGGLFTRLIERNTTIPTRAEKTFSTAVDDQPSIEVHVLQGEREFAVENRSLGRFELKGIPPMPRATPKIDVVFEIDANGIVAVAASERSTGVGARSEIRDAGGISEQEVARMIQDAEGAERADAERRALVERRNALEAAMLRLGQRRQDAAGDLAEETCGMVEDAVAEVVRTLGSEILDEARYLELNGRVLDAAAQVEDDLIAAASRRRRTDAPPADA